MVQQDICIVVSLVIILQLVAGTSFIGCVVAIVCHIVFVLSLLYLNHKLVRYPGSSDWPASIRESSDSELASKLQSLLRIWLVTAITCQYLIYQFVTMTFREIYLYENMLVFIMLAVAVFCTMKAIGLGSSSSVSDQLTFDEQVGFLHPHHCIWLGIKVPSTGLIARLHFFTHLLIIAAGCYAAHQTSTAVCTPVIVFGYFLWPIKCSNAFADVQVSKNESYI